MHNLSISITQVSKEETYRDSISSSPAHSGQSALNLGSGQMFRKVLFE